MLKEANIVNVALGVGKNIFQVNAKGNPATIVAVGAAAAIATAGTAVVYSGYMGAQKLLGIFDDNPNKTLP